jgi:hypothetical protein
MGMDANEHCIGQHFIVAPNIKYVTIVRDPLDRTYSHFRHEVRGYAEGACDCDPYSELMARNGFPWFCENLIDEVPWANNYMVKQLGVSNTKKSASHADFRLALSRLKLFSVVAVFDALASGTNIMGALGWPTPQAEFRQSESSARRALADHPAALDALYEANGLDLQLYKLCSRGSLQLPMPSLSQCSMQASN